MKRIALIMIVVLETLSIPLMFLTVEKILLENVFSWGKEMFLGVYQDVLAVLLWILLFIIYFISNLVFIKKAKTHFFSIAIYSICFYIIPYRRVYLTYFFKHTLLVVITTSLILIVFIVLYQIPFVKRLRHKNYES